MRLEKKVAEFYKEVVMLEDQAKELYDAAGEIRLKIGRLVKPNPIRSIKISKTELLEVRDLTKTNDLILGWGHGSVKRYELKVRAV